MKFEKARGFFGDDAKAFEAQLCKNELGKSYWKITEIEEGNYQKAVALFNNGLSQKEITEILGINKSGVSRHIKLGRQEGLLQVTNKLRSCPM